MKYKQRQKLFAEAIRYPIVELIAPISEQIVKLDINDDESFSNPDSQYWVDLDGLRKLCSNGIPDIPGYRPTCWKILLGYLPLDKRQWIDSLTQSRTSYYGFIKDLVDESGHKFPLTEEDRDQLKLKPELISKDLPDPLAKRREAYLADSSLLEQIDMDVRRTLSDHMFFQLPTCASVPSTRPASPTSGLVSPHSFVDPEPTPPWHDVNGKERRFLFDAYQPNRHQIIGLRKSRHEPRHRRASSNLEMLHSKRDVRSGTFTPPPNFMTSEDEEYDDITSSEPSPIASLLLPLHQLPPFNPATISHPLSPLNQPHSPILPSPKDQLQFHHHEEEEVQDLHWEAMERILFIYAKLNPGVGYVQGMNELLGPIYYVCANDVMDSALQGRAHAEADAFYLFNAVMSSVRDQYVKQLDRDRNVGVRATLETLEAKLSQVAPDLHLDLKSKNLEPTYYAFRWITVLGTQEFKLPDTIRLWDALFSHTPIYLGSENGFKSSVNALSISPLNTMVMVSVAMLCLVKRELMEGGFADNLKLLQSYPVDHDIGRIIELAYRLEALPPDTKLQFENLLPDLHPLVTPLPLPPTTWRASLAKFKPQFSKPKPEIDPSLQKSLDTHPITKSSFSNFSNLFNLTLPSTTTNKEGHRRTSTATDLKIKLTSSWDTTKAFLANRPVVTPISLPPSP